MNSIEPQTNKDQVWTLESGPENRFLFTSGCRHLIAARCEEPFYPVTRLFHILNHKDD